MATDAIELLGQPEMKFPRDLGVAQYDPLYRERTGSHAVATAYRHTFFRTNQAGAPVPGTTVEFYVPEWLIRGGVPGHTALQLVAERMGWGSPDG